MQAIFRVINIVFGPVLSLLFASRFSGITIAGRDAADVIGVALASLLVLAVELGLTQGPRHSAWLRRWLEPRAAFEGVWLQEVEKGPGGNDLGIFSVDYERDDDSFAVHGHSYSDNGRQWAKWCSTPRMFVSVGHLKATYHWTGELLAPPTPETDKSGLTELDLPKPPVFSLPMTGEGRVLHLGEATRVQFRLRRVTKRLLEGLDLSFTLRELRSDEHDEESQLVAAFLRKRTTQ
jgi:hypothetical protein